MLLEIIYSECPICKTLISRTDLVSYTLRHAQIWSDGMIYDSNYNEFSTLTFTKCEKCNNFYWFSECQQTNEMELNKYRSNANYDKNSNIDYPDIIKHHPELLNNSIEIKFNNYPFNTAYNNLTESFIIDLQQLLTKVDNNVERELYLRIKLWQKINDFIRFLENPFLSHIKQSKFSTRLFNIHLIEKRLENFKRNKKLYKNYSQLKSDNLIRLSKILEQNTSEIENQINLIEIYRELGNFEKSKEILKSVIKTNINSRYKTFLDKSNQHINFKSSKIFKI